MARIQRFEDITAWQRARELTRRIYATTKIGPFAKDFGLRDQIQRSSVSIMSNIAEGFERGGDKEFSQFLSVAKGSCGELRSQLYVALDQNYISEENFAEISSMAIDSSRLVGGMMRYLNQSPLRGSKYR